MSDVPGWLAALGIIVPAATGVGGYWLAGQNEEARDKRAAEREAENRKVLLAERLDERKHEFQLQLLLEMQDVLQRLVRSAAKVLMQDKRTLEEHGTINLLPPGMSDESYAIGVEYGRLKVRVLDDGLRAELDSFHTLVSALETTQLLPIDSPPEAAIARVDQNMRQLTGRYTEISDRLGQLLRAELGRVPEDSAPGR